MRLFAGPGGAMRRVAAGDFLILGALLALDLLFPPPIERGRVYSTLVTDRDGRPLRAFGAEEGRWRLRAELEDIDPRFIEALLEVEDQRFYRHWGVDGLAMIRATGSLLRSGRVVSGGSTITMQTARLLEPRPRNVGSKLIEMVRAIQLERRLSKDEILELYLTLTPYGGNLEGVRSASWAYFGREPQRLSTDQIALLIALPQSPERRRPDRQTAGARAGRAAVVARLLEEGLVDDRQAGEAKAADLPVRRPFPSLGWHVSDRIRKDAPDRGDVVSTIDAGLQAQTEAILSQAALGLEPEVQLSAMVVDVPGREVRALVGAARRDREGGWLDLTTRSRSPGSTLKPFIYGLAFDDGVAAPDTHIQDLPTRFADYRPENFDRRFRGDVRVRDALQHSLNVPAVLTLDRIGPERFASALSFSGVEPRISASARREAGLALALGGIGLTVEDLAMLYAGLADGGRVKPLVWQPVEAEEDQPPGKRLMSAESAAEIIDILKSAPMPEGRMPARLTEDAPEIAFKTGTSYGFRDAWAAGIARDLVVIVWVGRADGAPRPGATGRASALPVLFDIMDRAVATLDRSGVAGDRLTDRGRVASGGEQRRRFAERDQPPQILFPPNGAELWAGEGETLRTFVLSGRAQGRVRWFANGEPLSRDAGGAPIWTPEAAGFYTISAVGETGLASEVKVRVLTELTPG